MTATPATQALDRAGIAYRMISYTYAPAGNRVGLQAAQALGVEADLVVKTLMTLVDSKPVCVLLSSAAEVSLKLLAAAASSKSAQMMPAADAERLTGYRIGGISPIGQRRPVPTLVDRDVVKHPLIYLNGGQRGLQLHLSPLDVVQLLDARITDLCTRARS